MTLKKWLFLLIPLAILGGLVGWRFSKKSAEEKQVTQQGGGGGMRPGAGGGPGGGGPGGGGAPAVQVAAAGPRTITESLAAVGTAESPFRVQISPRSTGRIEYLQVREGDVVRPGQVLVRIDPSDLQAQVSQQEANVAEARSRLAQARLNQGPTEVGVASQIQQQRAALASAESDFKQVQRNYDSQVAAADATVQDVQSRVIAAEAQVRNALAVQEREEANYRNVQTKLARIQGLYEQGFLAAQELDDARTAAEVQQKAIEVAKGQVSSARAAQKSAESQLQGAKNQAAITRRKGQADIEAARSKVSSAKAMVNVASANRAQTPAYRENLAALEASVRAAEAQLEQVRARIRETVLTSPIPGTVTNRTADPGSLASPGQAVLVVQNTDWLFASASVPVEQSGSVVPGRVVQVKFDAVPGQVFTGPIVNVNPAADVQNRKIGFRVKLANASGVIKPGMFARLAIATKQVKAPVAVPKEAVRIDEGARASVTVVGQDQTATVREVQVGASDDDFTQILSGIEQGEQVVTMTFRPLRDGQKVRVGGGANGRGQVGQRGAR